MGPRRDINIFIPLRTPIRKHRVKYSVHIFKRLSVAINNAEQKR